MSVYCSACSVDFGKTREVDNLTHALAGAFCIDVAVRLAPRRFRPQPRASLYVASILANNLPDIDFAYVGITEGKLGYLLHHRGHTHTVVFALLLGLALYAAFSWRWRVSRGSASAKSVPSRETRSAASRLERRWLLAASLLGGLLHLVMDYGNNYGVHPFWPIDNSWYYGDTVFIIEPFLWVLLGMYLSFVATRWWWRGLCWLAPVLALVFVWFLPVPASGAWGVTVCVCLALALGFVARRPRARSLTFIGLLSVLYCTLLLARARVAQLVATAVESEPAFEQLELIRTPVAAAMWCWDVIVVGRERQNTPNAGADYVLRMARVGLVPSWTPAEQCPRLSEQRSAPSQVVALPSGPELYWDAEYRLPERELRALQRNCWFRAFTRFSRAPFYDPKTRTVGDSRYDRTAGEDFAEFALPDHGACPAWVPPWRPPRGDLFGDGS